MKRVLIVTGGSRGIGKEISIKAAQEDFIVVVNYCNDKLSAESTVKSIIEKGGKAISVQADTGKEEDVIRLFNTVKDKYGQITDLVNNAAITGGISLIENVKKETLNKVFNVNISGYFICAREAIKHMSIKKSGKGGSIINISSVAARLANPFTWVHYGASKGAIDTFTIGLAMECVEHGIKVNAIRPGLIDTNLNPKGRVNKIAPDIPLKRAGQAYEIAESVMWLLSKKSSYSHGSIIDVSGGR